MLRELEVHVNVNWHTCMHGSAYSVNFDLGLDILNLRFIDFQLTKYAYYVCGA